MSKRLIFSPPRQIPSKRDAIDFKIIFKSVDAKFIGTPEEEARTQSHVLLIGVTGTLATCWRVALEDYPRVLFEYGKRYLQDKVLDGVLAEIEELLLSTGDTEYPCPFDPQKIDDPDGYILDILETEHPIMSNESLLTLASQIIDARDNINALFADLYGENLIITSAERDILQFFKQALTQEEFVYRICALSNASGSMNVEKLRELTGTNDSSLKSISLLSIFLEKNDIDADLAIQILRSINRLRQCYPVHGNHVTGAIEAHRYFDISYPISDYDYAWNKILTLYLKALRSLLDKLKDLAGT